MHSEVETYPMTHDKDNLVDKVIGVNKNLVFLPDKVVYQQTSK